MRRKKQTLETLCSCLIAIIVSAANLHAADPIFVSMVQLLANPAKFDGVDVIVVGYCSLYIPAKNEVGAHGSDVLYLHREDSTAELTKNGVALRITPELFLKPDDYNGRYVIIKGTFDAKNLGFKEMYCGTIRNIQEVTPWVLGSPDKPKK